VQLYIIRHGQSSNNALGTEMGRSQDPVLTEIGVRQAEAVAAHLAQAQNPESIHEGRSYRFDHLYCSAMTRALQTALPISKVLGIRPEIWVELHEQGGIYLDEGEKGRVGYPGLTRAALLEQFPDYHVSDEVTNEGWWKGGYESVGQAAGRAINVAQRLFELSREGDQAIAMIGHGMFSNLLLKALFNQLPSPHYYYSHYNTGITRVDFFDEGFLSLRYLNRVSHLTPELMTF
jgi:broad specificity phosphatase PhoE